MLNCRILINSDIIIKSLNNTGSCCLCSTGPGLDKIEPSTNIHENTSLDQEPLCVGSVFLYSTCTLCCYSSLFSSKFSSSSFILRFSWSGLRHVGFLYVESGFFSRFLTVRKNIFLVIVTLGLLIGGLVLFWNYIYCG